MDALPTLQPITGEALHGTSAIADDGARLDRRCRYWLLSVPYLMSGCSTPMLLQIVNLSSLRLAPQCFAFRLVIITHVRPFAAPRALVQTRCGHAGQPRYIARYCVCVNSVSRQTRTSRTASSLAGDRVHVYTISSNVARLAAPRLHKLA